MIGNTTAPGARRRQQLAQQIADLDSAVSRLKDQLPYVNEPTLQERISVFIRASDDVVAIHGADPGPSSADQLNQLLNAIRALELPARDPDLGPTLTLERLEQATGIIAIRVINALDVAAVLGWVPTKPNLPDRLTASVPRHEVGSLPVRITERLDVVSHSLNELQSVEDKEPDRVPQKGLIEFYVGSVRVEINIARMQLVVGEQSIDFAGLSRVVEKIGEFTTDFISTLQDWSGLVSAEVVRTAETIGKSVRKVVSGIQTTIDWVIRGRHKKHASAAEALEEPPADFDLEEAKRMIVGGETPPAAWIPFITELDLGYLDFTSLTPVRELVQLGTLGLRGTQIGDLTALADLRRLQTLDLGGTAVRELQPLSRLANLETLVLWDTPTSDLEPLAGLKGLQSLDLSSTDVNDISALASLQRLQILYLLGTKVHDLSPLSEITSLRILSLMGTHVTDLNPLGNLINLQVLYLDGTAIGDLSPLAKLNRLRNLDLRRTAVRDLSPLASLTNLQNLSLSSGEYAGLSLLGDLANRIRWDN